jgi:hypothetical protein
MYGEVIKLLLMKSTKNLFGDARFWLALASLLLLLGLSLRGYPL